MGFARYEKNPSILEGFFCVLDFQNSRKSDLIICMSAVYCNYDFLWYTGWYRDVNNLSYDYYPNYCNPVALLGSVQINRLVRKNLKSMIALFIIAVLVFLFMGYVLIKPEKF
jgi:hypothetical protein